VLVVKYLSSFKSINQFITLAEKQVLRLVYIRAEESWAKLENWFVLLWRHFHALLSPKIFTLWGSAQPSSARISAWAGTVLRYSVGIIQEGGVFMRLHNISGRKSSSNGLYRHWNDRTCVLRMELHLDYRSFKNNSGVQWASSLLHGPWWYCQPAYSCRLQWWSCLVLQ